jgi:hypothetical protein
MRKFLTQRNGSYEATIGNQDCEHQRRQPSPQAVHSCDMYPIPTSYMRLKGSMRVPWPSAILRWLKVPAEFMCSEGAVRTLIVPRFLAKIAPGPRPLPRTGVIVIAPQMAGSLMLTEPRPIFVS